MFFKSNATLPLAAAILLGCAVPGNGQTDFGRLRLNVNPDHIANNDTLAWSLLGVLGVTLGMVSACGWGIYRHFHRQTGESKFLQELHELEKRPPPARPDATGSDPKRQPWEKNGDWWKKPPMD